MVAAGYRGVQVPVDEDVVMGIIFRNKVKTDKKMDIRIADTPQGWGARVKSYRFNVTGVDAAGNSVIAERPFVFKDVNMKKIKTIGLHK